jgi:parvulin-like peptidyl-prolyl isomerase
MRAIYTTPKLSKSASGWFVLIRYNGKQKRYKAGLNRVKCLKDRTIEANNLIKYLSKKLKSGWSPFLKGDVIINSKSFISALDFALEKKQKNVSKKPF